VSPRLDDDHMIEGCAGHNNSLLAGQTTSRDTSFGAWQGYYTARSGRVGRAEGRTWLGWMGDQPFATSLEYEKIFIDSDRERCYTLF